MLNKIISYLPKLSVSDFISILAFAIGCINLTITFHNQWKNKPRIKIIILEDSYFFEKLDKYKNLYGNAHAFFRMQLINTSSAPITIYDINVKHLNTSLNIKYLEETKIKLTDPKTKNNPYPCSITFDLSSQYKLPLRIEPYHVFDGFIFFGSLVVSGSNDIPLDIEIFTSRKKFKTKCKLSHFSTLDFAPPSLSNIEIKNG